MTDPLRTSLRLNNDLTVEEFVSVVRRAERWGFDQVWVSNDLYLRSAPVLLTAAALATQRVRLGVGIMNPYSVHPSEIAMMAATLAEVSDGRFLLGLGAGAKEFLSWAGIERPRPLARTRDAAGRSRHCSPVRDRPARTDDLRQPSSASRRARCRSTSGR